MRLAGNLLLIDISNKKILEVQDSRFKKFLYLDSYLI